MTSSGPVADLTQLLSSLRPALHPRVYVFASVPAGTDVSALQPIATFREAEGLTIVIEQELARQAGVPILFRAAWLTLTVHSDLHGVGLTAAVAAALTRANISCNVIAAAFHDHIFVPVGAAEGALAVLQALQREASAPMPAPRRPPVALAISFIDCINRGDLAALVALMSEDHRLEVFTEPPVAGRAANEAAWQGYMKALPRYFIHPHRISERDGVVAILGHTTGSHLGLPDDAERRYIVIWLASCRDGLIHAWRLVEDSPLNREQHGLA
jgi:uncharacterized protein